jgi:NACHT domain
LANPNNDKIIQTIEAKGSASISNVIQVAGDLYVGGRDRPTIREREVLIRRVRTFWIEGMLGPSLKKIGYLELQWEVKFNHRKSYSETVNRYGEAAFPSGLTSHSILEVLSSVSDYLLILGSPGSGKTTLLLTLTAALLGVAENDGGKPIPIVFSLSSWSRYAIDLERWLANELTNKYDVPPVKALRWIQNDEVAPLLDGFDEIAESDQQSCVEAIRAFRGSHGLLPLVITSRLGDYSVVPIALNAYGTVTLKPLTKSQVLFHLQTIRGVVGPLAAALEHDDAFWELVDSPLMLSMASTVLANETSELLNEDFGRGTWRVRLLDAFVEQALRNVKANGRSTEDIIKGLNWIANTMTSEQLSIFYLEDMQPSWLGQRFAIWFARSGAALLAGVFAGVSVGIPIALVGATTLAVALGLLAFFFVTSCLAGTGIANYRKLRWSWQKLAADAKSILSPPSSVPPANFAQYFQEILVRVLEMGLVEDEVKEFNGSRGRRRWLRNAFYTARHTFLILLLLMISLGSGGALLGFVLYHKAETLGQAFTSISIFLASACIPIIIWISLRRGPSDWFRHIAVRLGLAVKRDLPFRLDPFLQKIVGRGLMYRAGGGYVFVHRLFLEYFASHPTSERGRTAPPLAWPGKT